MKHLKLLLQSLFKNSACVEGGRTYPWWVAVLFFILSTAISLIPTTVSLYTLDAGTFITNAAYDTDKAFYEVLKEMDADGIDLQFYNEHTVENFNELKDAEGKSITPYIQLNGEWKEVDANGVKMPYVVSGKVISGTTKPETSSTITDTTYDESTVELLKVYVLDDVTNADISKKVNAVLQGLNPYVHDEIEGTSKTINKTSFILFGKESFVWIKYDANKTVDHQTGYTPVGQYTGTYRDVKCIKTLSELLKTQDEAGNNAILGFEDSVKKSAEFLREGYNELKLNNAAIQLAIYLAINAGIVLLMGFVLWLMTRGKNNPFRCYKIIETMKISAWTAFTPAILAMIFGFIMGSGNAMAGFMFVLMFGIRCMWLAMKNLRPAMNTK